MPYRTLGEMRATLMARLGMGAMGASGASQVLMNSFLSNGQTQLYWDQDWKHLTAYADKTLGVGQTLLDYPEACQRDRRILRVETVYGGLWRVLPEGIDTEHWSTMSTRSYPIRYDRYAQVLIYPEADQVYTIRFWYVQDLAPFAADGDACSLDDEMVLLHALATAKAHYRHPDAELYQGQLSDLRGSLRGQAFGRNGVYRRQPEVDIERRPLVVGRDI